MYEQIEIAIITGLIIAPLSSYITVRLSLARFKEEKRWERKVTAYERVLDGLHIIKKNNTEWENAFNANKPTPPTEKLEELDVKRKEAMDFLERAVDLGRFLLPQDVVTEIMKLLKGFREIEVTKENWPDIFEIENDLVESALESIRAKEV